MIGHASISEKGTVNGIKGDQTKKEVCIRSWYDKGWDCVIHITDKQTREKFAKEIRYACLNDHIGYGQNDRNSCFLYVKTNKLKTLNGINKNVNVDCSSLVSVCLYLSGFETSQVMIGNNAFTTSTMKKKLKATGKVKIYTDSKYLNSEKHLCIGDILLKEGSHVAVALGNTTVKENENKVGEFKMNTLQLNSSGYQVKTLQRLLKALGYDVGNSGVDGKYGKDTQKAVKLYQKNCKLSVDGIVGKNTWNKLLKGV